MIQLAPQGEKKYAIVTAGNIIFKDNTTYIKCALCGKLCTGITQQGQVGQLFECLATHIPEEHLYEVYEQRDDKIVTTINLSAWIKARKETKYKR